MYLLCLYQHKNFQSCAFSFCQGKLVKLFSRQLVAKQKCNEDWNHNEKLRYYPKLEQWLQVVGINEEAIKVHVCYFMCTLHFYIVTFACPTKSYSVHLCTLLPTPPPVEHNCEPGFLHLFNFLSVCELPLQSNTRQNCMCRWCLHHRQCNPTKGWGVWNIFVRSTDMEENNGLKAGWQINSATSLNIYLCRLEIISCCEMSIKKLPLLHYFSSGNFLACQGNIPNLRNWWFSLFLCKITCNIGSKFNQTHPECIICYWISIININSSFQSLLPWRVNLVLARLLNLIFIFCLLSF